MSDSAREERYKVVVNHEEQYSVWRIGLDDPPGWRDIGVEGSRDDCLAYIAAVWTDMRPASLRRAMQADR
ncbi:MbtH family protein [Saccharothrix deserti]|uniref:MbtH family protein n=1 Tax=Saccharothrix deserti TaxID=2593674 RepID=UPI00131D72B2|nr:MbtH family NRPS accessory protein [Saccharothrix deserti]